MQTPPQNEMKAVQSPKFDDSYRKGIRMLLDSHDVALAKGLPGADFAVELEELQTLGMTKFQVRRLLAEKFVECGVEKSRPGQAHRSIRWLPLETLNLPANCCVRLTPAGAGWGRAFLDATRENSAVVAGNGSASPLPPPRVE